MKDINDREIEEPWKGQSHASALPSLAWYVSSNVKKEQKREGGPQPQNLICLPVNMTLPCSQYFCWFTAAQVQLRTGLGVHEV